MGPQASDVPDLAVPPAAGAAGASPRWHPPAAVLELAELVSLGALPALPGAGLHLAPPHLRAAMTAGAVLIEDAEGTPVARVLPGGTVEGLRPFTHPPLRSGRRAPAEVRSWAAAQADAPGPVAVPVSGSIPAAALDRLRETVRPGTPIVWLALVGAGRPADLTPEALLRAVRSLAAEGDAAGRPGTVVPVAVPFLHDEELDRELVQAVALAHGAATVVFPGGAPDLGAASAGAPPHPSFARELAQAVRPPHRRGVALLLTGLSGSGKSTIARGLVERLRQDGRRTVTVLDGDEVRRLLSQGLGFGRADRDLNIRRIGFVAAEVARHGGLAVAAPIAPFDAARQEVRAMVTAAGGDLVLVHVATPLQECERRDGKGLYARARRGEIPEFTGISSPYEEPADADLTLDTTGRPVRDCVEEIWQLLAAGGYLGDLGDLGDPGDLGDLGDLGGLGDPGESGEPG